MLVQARLVKRGNENQFSMENVPHVENKTWKSQHLPWTSMDFHVVPGFSILNSSLRPDNLHPGSYDPFFYLKFGKMTMSG